MKKLSLLKILFESSNRQITNLINENEKKFNPTLNYLPIPQFKLNNKKVILTLSDNLKQINNNDKNKLFVLIKDFFEKQEIQVNLTKDILIDFKKNLIEEIPDILSQTNMKNISVYKLLPTLKIKNIDNKIIDLELDFNYNPESKEKNFSIKGSF